MHKRGKCVRIFSVCTGYGGSVGSVKNCYNIGIIKSNTAGAAGIRNNFGNTYNCCNFGKAIAGGLQAGYKGVGGIAAGAGSDGGVVVNCCSSGQLSKLSGTSLTQSGLIAKRSTLTNCYYLDGIDENVGLTPETGATVFYKTSENEEDMTTEKVVEKLNEYIRLKGVLEEGDTEVDTAGWCRWKVGENNLPELELEWEWNPTAGENGTGAFVKVNN